MYTDGHTRPHTPAQLFTIPEVAQLLSCSTRSVKRWIAAGLPVVHLGAGQRDRRVSETDLEAWVEARKVAGQ